MTTWQKQLTNLRHKQQLMYILVFSLATVVVWVTVSLVGSQRRTEIPKELLDLAKPLNPTINRQVLNQLQSKRAYAPSELQAFPIYKTIIDKSGTTSKVTIDTPEPERGLTVRSGEALVTSPSPVASPSPSPDTSASGSGVVTSPLPSPSPAVSPTATPGAAL